MAAIIAQGETENRRLRRSVRSNESLTVGRAPPDGSAAWRVPWESRLSRRHFEVCRTDDSLRITQLPDAVNPIFFHGEPARTFSMHRGDCFVVGRTIFTWETDEGSSSVTPESAQVVHSFTVSPDELRQVPFRDAPHRLDVLGHLTKVIFSVVDDADLFAQAGNMLLEGIRRAAAVAVVALDEPVESSGGVAPSESGEASDSDEHATVRYLHVDRRLASEEEFRPSRRLVREALLRQGKSVVHVWTEAARPGEEQFTLQGDFDWAFCTPVRGETNRRTGIYVAGRSGGVEPSALLAPWRTNDLSEDVKFAELVADILGALRQTRDLQHRQSVLSHFFSPGVLQILSTADPETALRPKETQVTALFCDLRGFARKVETAADDLTTILDRVSAALGVMSTAILRQKGVVADFLGDCAMGFWGWPIARPDDGAAACRAALEIRAAFEQFATIPGHPLADFKVGVGIATGRAVAGRIGSRDQAKVTAFGPSVNLAARLEGLTKILRVPVLVDEATVGAAGGMLPAAEARCRRLARIRPYGLEQPVMVSELLAGASVDRVHTDAAIGAYEAALTAFLEGRWSEAYDLLHQIPPHDVGKDFLVSYILEHNHTPPAGWDGVITIGAKR